MTSPQPADKTRHMRWDQHVDATVEATGRGRYPRPEENDLSWLDLADRDMVEGPRPWRRPAWVAARRLRRRILIAVLVLIPLTVVIIAELAR